ncbi:MAG TPA: polysaccharide biosynthesis/export family protein, partial [Pyrinomonadaceae bacterium]
MKVFNFYKKSVLLSAGIFIFSFNSSAQTGNPPVKIENAVQTENKPVAVETPKTETKTTETAKPADAPANPEEAEILPFYNNYLNEYRLGPNDVITVEVFGQCPDYCKTGITVPPTARISYPLIREGVMVGGKTVEQIADEITKKLDEYIIEPKVTVTLDKAMSARYSVLGKVAAPGVRVLDRKVSVY